MAVVYGKNNIEEDPNMEKRRRQLACVGAGACTLREDAIVDSTRKMALA
jgi:hypothetical protein